MGDNHDKNGRLETETRNGITNTYAYNKAGLMTSNGEGINISYRLDGKESSRTQNGKTTYYAYDKIGQLTSERTGNISTSYTYDGWGNRATKAVGNDITSYEYDRTNRLMSEIVSELGAAKRSRSMSMIRYVLLNLTV